jgi:hypothetical protein
MKLLNWLLSKLKVILKHRLEIKTLPIFEKLIQLRIGTEPVNIKDYLNYEYYSFDDNYRYKEPNQACMFIVVITDNQEIIFLKRTFCGEWLKVKYHTDQLLKALVLKVKLIAIGRKIRKLYKS